jgi:hypothetical protein
MAIYEAPKDANSRSARPKEVLYDETPSMITDHVFEPRAEWWTLCKHCRLSEAAHMQTSLTGREHIHYYSDDQE